MIDDKDEYPECSEDWRHRDRLIWATPPVIITVSSIVVGVAFQVSDLNIRLLILIMGIVLTFTMLHGYIRHRHLRIGSEELIKQLHPTQKMLRRYEPTGEIPPRYPPKYFIDDIEKELEKHPADTSILISSWLAFFILFILVLYTLYEILYALVL